MELNLKITYGLIGVLALIITTLGRIMILSENQLNNVYICNMNHTAE